MKALLGQTSVQEQYLQAKSNTPTTADVLEDLRDGKIIKNNALLNESPSLVSIMPTEDLRLLTLLALAERSTRF